MNPIDYLILQWIITKKGDAPTPASLNISPHEFNQHLDFLQHIGYIAKKYSHTYYHGHLLHMYIPTLKAYQNF